MNKLVIVSQDPADAKILEDLLRAYFPGIIPQHQLVEEGNYFQPDNSEDTIFLFIEAAGAQGYQTTLRVNGKGYQGFSLPASYQWVEPADPNLRRRMLRLSVHRALVPYLSETKQLVSPWGILTGVRPTKIVHRLLKHGLTGSEVSHTLEAEYGIEESKAKLVTAVAAEQLPYLAKIDRQQQVSLYVAIPFCPSRCHYCSFPAFAMGRWGYLLDGYLVNLAQEIQAVAEELTALGLRVQTLYVGGGTPTVLTATQLAALLELLQSYFKLDNEQEVTVEAGRPDTLDKEKLQILKDHGVSRISINPQTLHDPTLAAIGRAHQTRDIYRVYEQARELAFPVINMDLIVGLPGENREILKKTIQGVLNLQPENITLHDLALKRGAFFKQTGISLPSPNEGAQMTALAQELLAAAGYRAYYLYRQKEILGHGENVGYCLPGKASVYNILMMEEQQTILGLGVGAGSKIVNPDSQGIDNFYNPKDLTVYNDRLAGIIARKVDKLRSFVYNNCK